MNTLLNFARSSIGRKAVMGVTGLALAVFVITHLIGNFTLLIGAEAFNGYAYFLEHLAHGMFIKLAEAGLIAFFLIHGVNGIQVYHAKKKARAKGYMVEEDAGGASRKSLASRSMIITGPLLLVFVVLHVIHFKYGPGMDDHARYVYDLHGKEIRNLYLMVVEEFQNPLMVLLYTAAMVGLGFNLVHGIWSGIQSLGVTNKRYLPGLVTMSLVLGTALAIGFIYIHIHIMVFLDPGTLVESFVQSTGGHP
jgi:succinate dehydrogenase / fumarate reductase cytochrome b subunit